MKLSLLLSSLLVTSTIIVGCGDSNTTQTKVGSLKVETDNANVSPAASDVKFPLALNTKGSFSLTAVDADKDPITFSQTTQPAHGQIVKFDEKTGTFIYEPEEGFTGKDTFKYTASDGASKCPEKTVTIEVEQTDISVPLAPTALKATRGCSCSVDLTWEDNSDNEDGFEIYKDGELICVKDADETSITIHGLSASTTYTFEVRAKNRAGSSSPAITTFTTQAALEEPAAPSNLSVVSKDENLIRISWDNNTDNVSEYVIYQNGEEIKTISKDCTSAMICGLAPDTSYTFTVKAKNDAGLSSGVTITATTDAESSKPTPPANKAPTVTTGSNKVITLGDTVSITATASDSDGTVVKYEWKEGANILSTQKDFDYKPTTVGEHHLVITVTDDKGATASAPVKVVVKEKVQPQPDNKAPTANAGADKSVEVNKAVTLVGSGTDSDGTIASYKWTENGVTKGTSATLNYTPTTVGTHTLTLTVTDNDGATASDSVKVTATEAPDNTPPVITLKGNETVTITVGDNYNDAGATATDDKDGDITNKIAKTGNVDTNTAGTYTITYKVKDAAGNEATATRTVIVNPAANKAPTANAGADKSVEIGESVTLNGSGTDSDGNIVKYEWKENGNTLSSQKDFDYKPRTVGDHTLTLTVTDNDGATASDTVVVTATDPYADYSVAKDFGVHDVSKEFDGFTIKILTLHDIGDHTGNENIIVYGQINGKNTNALLGISGLYPIGTSLIVRAYRADGTIAGTSKLFTYDQDPINFGSFTAQ